MSKLHAGCNHTRKNVQSSCIKLTDHAILEANLTTHNIYFVVGSYPVSTLSIIPNDIIVTNMHRS